MKLGLILILITGLAYGVVTPKNLATSQPIGKDFAIMVDLARPKTAFGRIKVAGPAAVYFHKNIHNLDVNSMAQVTSGAGAAITYLPNESSVELQVGTVSGGRALRQTNRYFAYLPGKTLSFTATAVLGAGKANVKQRIGFYDDDNGLFFENTENELCVVIRSSTSGTPVDSRTCQSNWNVDKMDGSGPSDVTLDTTKAQIFDIDFQWLGTGRVRFKLNVEGQPVVVHEINHANAISTVYMTTPTLPVRYEIINTGTSASTTVLKEICFAISSEGGYQIPGSELSVSNATSSRSVTARVPILAIRLANSIDTKKNRRQIEILHMRALTLTNNAFLELAHVHTPIVVTGSWTLLNGSSGVEYSTDISAIAGAHEHVIDSLFGVAGQAGKGSSGVEGQVALSEHSYVSQNIDSDDSQMFVIFATSFTGTANVSAAIDFLEYE